ACARAGGATGEPGDPGAADALLARALGVLGVDAHERQRVALARGIVPAAAPAAASAAAAEDRRAPEVDAGVDVREQVGHGLVGIEVLRDEKTRRRRLLGACLPLGLRGLPPHDAVDPPARPAELDLAG